MREAGLIYSDPPEVPFDARWDPNPGGDYVVDESGLTGEDAGGVWSRIHPDILLEQEPELWGVVDEFFSGRRRISERDIHTKSNKELEAKMILVSATRREERRYLRSPPKTESVDGE